MFKLLIYVKVNKLAFKKTQNKQTNKKLSNLSDSTILYNTLYMIFYLNYIFWFA